MTECASVVFCNPQQQSLRKIGTPGLPCGVETRVVSTETSAVLADGITGELQLRGDNVMLGYYNASEKTADAVTPDGWLRTGDLGHRDVDGFYFVTGRIKELIIKGGENIAPREIDEALLIHPAVLEAAAVGIPDTNYGQEILAAVVLKPGAECDEATLREFCVRGLGRYKTPKVFRFVNELPKGPSGKVARQRRCAAVGQLQRRRPAPSRAAGRARRRRPAARCRPRCSGRCRGSRRPSRHRSNQNENSGCVVSVPSTSSVARPDADDAAPGARADQRADAHQLEAVREDVAVGAGVLVGQRHHRPGRRLRRVGLRAGPSAARCRRCACAPPSPAAAARRGRRGCSARRRSARRGRTRCAK